jgi:plasmid maintenance system killer protein
LVGTDWIQILALFSFWVTTESVIRSFSDPVAEKIFRGEKLSRKEQNSLGDLRLEKAQERLVILNQAAERDLMNLQSLHYHKLHGEGRYSIDANSRNSKWRITFTWANEELTDVELVEIEDTHS